MQNQNSFLLSYVKYGDNDAVLHCFTADSGFQSFFAKGIYSPRNKKKPYLFPLSFINISVVERNSRNNIRTIAKIESAPESYQFDNVKMNSVLFFVADFLHQTLREELQNQLIFDEIIEFRRQVSAGNSDAYIAFMVKFLQISGIAPQFSEHTFLNPYTGVFSYEMIHQLFDEDLSAIWKDFLKAVNRYEIRLNRAERSHFTDSVMMYYKLHFTGFYVPDSLEILRQVYN